MSRDPILDALTEFATETAAISPALTAATVDHVVDGWGCAIAALAEPTAQAAQRAAAPFEVAAGASAMGLTGFRSPDHAAFVNACLMRSLDWNDTFNSLTGGHPSDMIAGLFALGENANVTGLDVLRGVAVAYQVFATLADSIALRDLGWDQSILVAVGTAVGGAAALRMDRGRAAHAISLAVTAAHSLRVSRSGELSMWKAGATAHASRMGVELVGLAAVGMHGPEQPFTGRHGLVEQLGTDVDVSVLAELHVPGSSAVERTAIKFLPVEWSAQAPVETVLAHSDDIDIDDVESIIVDGHAFLVREIGGGRGDAAAKWDPRTRETADHSLAYLLAVALTDGRVDLDSFTPARVNDPRLRPLMRRIEVRERADASDLPPNRQPVDMVIRMSGRTLRLSCEYPFGHPERPAASAEVDAKFLRLAGRMLSAEATASALGVLRDLPNVQSLEAFGAVLRAVRPAGS